MADLDNQTERYQLVVFVGPSGSGKTMGQQYLKEWGYVPVHAIQPLYEAMAIASGVDAWRLQNEKNEHYLSNEITVADWLRECFEMDLKLGSKVGCHFLKNGFAKQLEEHKRVSLASLRSPAEVGGLMAAIAPLPVDVRVFRISWAEDARYYEHPADVNLLETQAHLVAALYDVSSKAGSSVRCRTRDHINRLKTWVSPAEARAAFFRDLNKLMVAEF